MLVKYIYPVKSTVHVFDGWPIKVNGFTVELGEAEGIINSISVAVPVSDLDKLPSVTPSRDPRAKFKINLGTTHKNDEVVQFLITVQGLLSLFGPFSIDLANGRTEWLPESPQEKEKLSLYSFSQTIERPYRHDAAQLTFDFIARMIFTAPHASSYEVPLSFIRRGGQDMRDDRFIEAFYNYFFFLETLFAPGFSKPKVVKEKLLASPAFTKGIAEARKQIDSRLAHKERALVALLAKSDKDLTNHLVDTRGNLHHHALRRPDVWHPERPDRYKAEAMIIQGIAHSIALSEAISLIYSSERDETFMKNTRAVDAMLKLRVDVTGRTEGGALEEFQIDFHIPGRKPHRAMVNRVHQDVRKRLYSRRPPVQIEELRISSGDGTEAYATYCRPRPTEVSGAIKRKVDDESA